MRIAYFGHRRIALGTLERLLADGRQVAGIVAHPETFEPSDAEWNRGVRDLARTAGIPLETPTVIDEAFLATFRAWNVDLGIVVGYMSILRSPILEIPRLGLINVHAGMLPRYRGRAPLCWAILNGEKEAGLSIHFIDAGVDSGPVIAQRAYPIHPDDTAGLLYERVQADIPAFVLEVVAALEAGPVETRPQDPRLAMCFPAISPAHARIDWSRPAHAIHNQVRALARPYPGAWTRYHDRTLRVWKARPVSLDLPGCFPGTVVNRWPGLGIVVSTGIGYLLVEEAAVEGQEPGPADEVVRRAGVSLGLETGSGA